MKAFLAILAVACAIFGLAFSPYGMIGPAALVCGAVFLASAGIIEAIQRLGKDVQDQAKMIRNAIRFVEEKLPANGEGPGASSAASTTPPAHRV